MPLPQPPPLAFARFVIDFAGRRLLKDGETVALEPKAFAVLEVLVNAPGQALNRDEILDAVWGHRHVTPGVLNRIMTLLRHALGEDAHAPRYLHTLHGVGYRFDLPVVVASEQAHGTATKTGADPRAMSGTTGPVTEPAVATAPGVISESRRRRPGDDKPRAFPRATLWLLPLLAVLAFTAWTLWSRGTPVAGPTGSAMATKPATTPTLVVMPLKPIGDSESTRTIADGLSEELIGSVARIEGLRVIARESTRLAAAESDDPALLAQKLGITHLLEGSLQQAGQALRIHLRLVDTHGRALWARDFDRDASEVLLMQREIAESVATSLTLKLGLATVPGKSGDAEFLARFLAAQTLLYNQSLPLEQRQEPAEAEFRALLRERPDDARVHSALAVALNFRASSNQRLPASVRDDGLQEAIVAQRLDPSLAEPYFVQAFIACQRNQWEACVSLMHEADMRGMKTPPLANPAVVMARLGYLDHAEDLAREIVARDPLNNSAHFTLGRVLDTMGRHDEANAELLASRHSIGFNRYGHWFNAYWRKDYAEAGKLVEEGLGANDASWPKLMPSYVAMMRAWAGQGSWAEVEAENLKFEQDTGLFALLRVLLPNAPAHAPELIIGLERMRKGSYSTWDLVLWEKEFAFLRQDPAFQDYLHRNGILDYWRKHGFPKQCHPQGVGAACD